MANRLYAFVDLCGNTYGITAQGFTRKKKSKAKKPELPPPHKPNEPPCHNKNLKFQMANEFQFLNFYQHNEKDPTMNYGSWQPNNQNSKPNRFASPNNFFDSNARVRTVNSDSEDASRGRTSVENNPGISNSGNNQGSRSQTRNRPQSHIPVPVSPQWPTMDTPPRFEVAARQLDHTVKQAIAYFDAFVQKFNRAIERVRFCADAKLLNQLWGKQIADSEKRPGCEYFEDKPASSLQSIDRASTEDLHFREHQQKIITYIGRFLSANTTAMHSNAHGSPQVQNDVQRHKQYMGVLQDKVRASCSLLLQSIQGMSHDHTQAEPTLNELRMIESALYTYRRTWDKNWSNNNNNNATAGNNQADRDTQ